MPQIFQVEFNQKYLIKNMKNVFHFAALATAGTTSELATKFKTDYVPKIELLQYLGIESGLLRVTSLFDLGDFTEEELTTTGANSEAEMMPLHDAVNFTLRTNTRAVRPGKKRISGFVESKQSKGMIVDATFISALNTLRVQLATPSEGGSGAVYTPVIIKRVKETDEETGEVTYRLPATEGELVYGVVQTALVNLQVTTQRSRR